MSIVHVCVLHYRLRAALKLPTQIKPAHSQGLAIAYVLSMDLAVFVVFIACFLSELSVLDLFKHWISKEHGSGRVEM